MLKEEKTYLVSPVSDVSGISTTEGKQASNTGDIPLSPVSPIAPDVSGDDPLALLTSAQLEVAQAILAFAQGSGTHRMATLAGYAGVGKTTVVAAVVRSLPERLNVAVLAPTHKALSVLSEKLSDANVEAMTLQSALALRVKERPDGLQDLEDTGDPGSLREFDLAIVDEASMISAGMFATAMFKRGHRCRILFVGDPAQLTPIDRDPDCKAGKEQLSPVFGEQVPLHWKLTQVVRQAQENPIIRLATAARECIAGGQEFGLQTMVAQLREGDDAFLAMQPGGVAEISNLVADAIAHGQDTRALAFDNATVQAINANVHAMVFPGQGPYPDGTLLMAQDGFNAWKPETLASSKWEKVPVRNSALLTVRGMEEKPHPAEPGRLALLLHLEAEDGGKMAAWVPVDERQWQADISQCFADYRRLQMREKMASGSERRALHEEASSASQAGWALKARYANLRYAYAMTVHKAQGSTFDAVVLDWSSFRRSRDIQLRNRLAYVALTRTRRFAVVCA